MGKRDLSKLYKTQKSLTEWLEDIRHSEVAELRHEDNEKRERLRVLNEVIGLPFDKPVQFTAEAIAYNIPEHSAYVVQHGDELCALRLIPLDKTLPKLRMRGQRVHEVQQWFREQDIDPTKYRAEYIAHSDMPLWSTIFVVNKQGVFGEIICGGHHQLTQGLHDEGNEPYTFVYNFKSWQVVPQSDEVLRELQRIMGYLNVSDSNQTALQRRLGSTFTGGYIEGYFETTESKEFGLWFIDYAPKLGAQVGQFRLPQNSRSEQGITGQVASAGQASGRVRIVEPNDDANDFMDGDVLVCTMTTPDLVPFMQRAAAIVTDQGGILSHAAIVARELKKPCIVGTGNATYLLATGDQVLVDANHGSVKKIEI